VWDDKNLDPDGDGITDKWEAFYGFDPNVADGGADPDRDGLSSAEEIAGGSSPVDADIDADGLNDKQEREQGTSPWRGDTDYDSLRDGWEVANAASKRGRALIIDMIFFMRRHFRICRMGRTGGWRGSRTRGRAGWR
jgi:hypothetical protein